MRKKNTIFLISVFLTGVGIFLFSGLFVCRVDGQEIRLGMDAPLTGPTAEIGIGMKQGALILVDDYNAKGGIFIKEYGKKVPIKLFIDDHQGRPDMGVSIGEKFITRDNVHVQMIGAISSVAMAEMELAPKYGIPVVSLQCVTTEISKKVAKDPDRYWSFWKTCHGSEGYARTIFSTYQYLIEGGSFKPQNKTIAHVVEDTDYGRANIKAAIELFEAVGWRRVADELVPIGHTDFYPQLTKLKALKPDIIITVFGALSSGIAFARQFHEVGLKSSHFAQYYPTRPEYIPAVGKAGDFLLWTPLWMDPENIPSHKALEEKVRKRFNVKLTADHGYCWDELGLVIDAIERAASLKPKAIVEAISKTDRQGFFGRYVFDQKTHSIIEGPGYFEIPAAQIQEGKSVMIWPPARTSHRYQKQPWIQ